MAEFFQRYRLSTDHTYARQPLPLEKIEARLNPEVPKKRRGGTCCCVKGCSNREGIGVSFHRFPTDRERRDKWISAIKREGWKPNTHTRICGDHFIAGKSEDPTSPDFVPSVFKAVKFPPTEKAQKRKIKMEENSEVRSLEYSMKPVIIMSEKPDNVVVIGPNHINYSRDTRGLVRCGNSITPPVRTVVNSSKTSDLSNLPIYRPHITSEDTKSAALALLELSGPSKVKKDHDYANLTHASRISQSHLTASTNSQIYA